MVVLWLGPLKPLKMPFTGSTRRGLDSLLFQKRFFGFFYYGFCWVTLGLMVCDGWGSPFFLSLMWHVRGCVRGMEGAYWVWVRMDTSGLAFAGFYRAYNSIHYLFLINYFHIELMNFTHNYKEDCIYIRQLFSVTRFDICW